MLAFLRTVDHAVFDWIAAFHTAWLDTIMLAASHVGARAFVWLVGVAIAFVFPERRAAAWRALLAIGLTALIVDGITKPLIWRDRPYVALASARVGGEQVAPAHAGGVKENTARDVRVIDSKPLSSSFPSGHAATAVAGATVLSRLFPSARIVWWVLAGLIVVSRVYVGVHFPLDVLAGALMGLFCARLVIHDVKPQRAPFAIGLCK